MKNTNGFSLIEIVVVIAIMSFLMAGGFFIGFPEYDKYVISSELEYFVDTILESRARSLANGEKYIVSTWANGYCIKDVSELCITPIHNLPSNISIDQLEAEIDEI